MKKTVAILTALCMALAIVSPANAVTSCIEGIHSAESCYDNGYGTGYVDGWVVGFFIGAGIVGGITVVALLIHNHSKKPGTVVQYSEESVGLETNSNFFLQPDIAIASDQKFGLKTGFQW